MACHNVLVEVSHVVSEHECVDVFGVHDRCQRTGYPTYPGADRLRLEPGA